MNEDAKSDKARFSRLMDKFDRVLRRHLRRLVDSSDSESNTAFSLSMIACLLILVEREKEIADFPGTAPKRYNRQSFLKDIDEIGFDPDDHLMVEIQNLAQSGHIHIGANEEYRALEPATKFLSLMDGIFPSMPGLSLIAYTLQAIDEVMTGRKEIMHALRQYDETLLTRGQSISKQRFEAIRRQRVEAAKKKDDPGQIKQREAYIERLRALRSKLSGYSSDPAIVTTSGFSNNVTVRDLFPKASDTLAPPLEGEAVQPSDEGMEEQPSMLQEIAPPLTTPSVPTETIPPFAAIDAPVENEPARPDLIRPVETQPEETPHDEAKPPDDEELSEEEIIAQKVKAFEELLAMTCPLCNEGKILSNTTEKEKTYYYCSNKNCNLVTWGRPHHVTCPICRSPFLIEFQQQDGGVGLKCPRATCAFQRKNYDAGNPAGLLDPGDNPNVRKVAIRTKSGKKAVRRVVRRKA